MTFERSDKTLEHIAKGMEALSRDTTHYTVDAYHKLITCWALHTHFLDSFDHSPRIIWLSHTPNSGKTVAAEVTRALSTSPDYGDLMATSIKAAAVARVMREEGILFFDEAEKLLASRDLRDELTAFINTGWERRKSRIICDGADGYVKQPLFGAIGMTLNDGTNLAADLLSRSFVIRMETRPGFVSLPPAEWLARAEALQADLRALGTVVLPEVATSLDSRARNAWTPILRVAAAVGWYDELHALAVTMARETEDADRVAGKNEHEDLRRDLVQAYEDDELFAEELRGDFIPTQRIVDALYKVDTLTWGEYSREQLAKKLSRLMGLLGVYVLANARMHHGSKLRGYKARDVRKMMGADTTVPSVPSVPFASTARISGGTDSGTDTDAGEKCATFEDAGAGHETLQPRKKKRLRIVRDRAWSGEFLQKMTALTFKTYGTECIHCGLDGADTADHVIPQSQGGEHTLKNLAPSHRPCNSRRKDAPLTAEADARWKLCVARAARAA